MKHFLTFSKNCPFIFSCTLQFEDSMSSVILWRIQLTEQFSFWIVLFQSVRNEGPVMYKWTTSCMIKHFESFSVQIQLKKYSLRNILTSCQESCSLWFGVSRPEQTRLLTGSRKIFLCEYFLNWIWTEKLSNCLISLNNPDESIPSLHYLKNKFISLGLYISESLLSVDTQNTTFKYKLGFFTQEGVRS